MKKHTVICRLLISFGCIVFLLTSCDDSAKSPKKPTVVRKKITAKGQPKGTATAQRPSPAARPVKKAPQPAAPEVKPVKAEKPPVAKPPPAAAPVKPAVTPPVSQPPQKPVVAKAEPKPRQPAGGNEVPKPKSDISELTPGPKPSPQKAKAGADQTGTPKTLLASTDGDKPLYNPAGKIDPFEPLFRNKPSPEKIKKSKRKRRVPRTPLERIDISQLKLVGIILAGTGNRALVEESSGKGYVIKKGTYIGTNAGKVTDIKKDMVIVEEEFEDVFGKLKVQKKELKLPKPPGEL
jgi:type IV pilus assembly protein PilP